MQKNLVRYFLWGSASALVVAALVFAFRPQPVAVDFATVSEDKIRITVADEGMAEVQEVYRVSAPVAGRLLRVQGEVGDAVVAGESEIARIEPSAPVFLDVRTETEARATLEAARASENLAAAELKRAQADLTFTAAEVERSRELFANGTIAKQKLDQDERANRIAVADLLTAQARLDQRRHEVEVAQARLVSPTSTERSFSDCECLILRAPVDGEILQILEESETTLPAGAGVLEIGDPRDLQIVVDLLSEDAVKVLAGMPAVIDGWGGSSLKAIVRRVEPFGYTKVSALGIDEQRVDVLLDLIGAPDTWARLRHGYRVDVTIVLDEIESLAIPLGAVFRTGDTWSVFTEEDGRAVLRTVELGARNAEHAEVVSGLEAGARVILHPSDQVTDGARIEAR
ncbi:HlyD family efflux transporter periplasmic adaptor subunit [Thalassospiraceae bacterium LMO-JJ14]|nr:HlyD family efflux transporter periplasmic adaptor subunit [Thalassospiraceae bacterium LMO-JJ14]